MKGADDKLDHMIRRLPVYLKETAELLILIGDTKRALDVVEEYNSSQRKRRADALETLVRIYSTSDDPISDVQRRLSVSRIDATILVRMLTLLTEEIHTMRLHLPMCR